MGKGSRNWILLVVLAFGAAGWLIGQETPRPTTPPPANPAQAGSANRKYPTPVPPYPKPKNWTLTVGPDPCQVREAGVDVSVAVILREKHWIKYQSDSNQLLAIVFHAPSDNKTAPAPFKKMTFAGTDEDGSYLWQLVCEKANVCSTGPAVTGSKGGYWKTDQILEGKPKCDAGIIIQP